MPSPKLSLAAMHGGVLAALTVLVLALLIPAGLYASLFVPGPSAQEQRVVVTYGSSPEIIAQQLQKQHLIFAAPLFRLAVRLYVPAGTILHSGEFAIPARASVVSIVNQIRDGRSIVRLFTVAEGLSSAEVVALLNQDEAMTGTIATLPPEGSLLPETYRYTFGDSRGTLIGRMQRAMQEKVAEIWDARDVNLYLRTEKDLVVLASIVEKETGKKDERTRIAGVFYNRLHSNMRLQSDPTVIYALTRGKVPLNRPLNHDDLSTPSPYNTYAADGLPPQPICNPGEAALQAVAHPDQNSFLYFVADGTGGHAFARDLASHNENVTRWRHALEAGTARQ